MRPISTLQLASALFAAALLASGAPAQDSPARPDPVPLVTGMAFVPGGEFLMGSTADDIRKTADVDEYPQRKI